MADGTVARPESAASPAGSGLSAAEATDATDAPRGPTNADSAADAPRGPTNADSAADTPRGPTNADSAAADTPALRAIAAAGIPHRVVRSEAARSAEEAAAIQGIDLAALIRTIVVRRGDDDYLFVLVPAGRRFDWPKLRAHLGVSRMSLPDAEEARAVTGYERYTITPFGATRAWPVIADASLAGRHVVSIGGGARGVNLHLSAADLFAATGASVVDVSQPESTESR